MTDWIYSRDRLPDVGVAVIGSLIGDDGIPWIDMVECVRDPGLYSRNPTDGRQWMVGGDLLPADWNVYAWMPVPDPAAVPAPAPAPMPKAAP